MPSDYLSRTLSLPSDEKEANYSNSDRGGDGTNSRILVAAASTAPTNFCDAFGGDILQPSLSLQQIALLSSPLHLRARVSVRLRDVSG